MHQDKSQIEVSTDKESQRKVPFTVKEKLLVLGENPSENETEDKGEGGQSEPMWERKMESIELMKTQEKRQQQPKIKNGNEGKYMCLCGSISSNTCTFVYVIQDVPEELLQSFN